MNAPELSIRRYTRSDNCQLSEEPTYIEEITEPPYNLEIVDMPIRLNRIPVRMKKAGVLAEVEPRVLLMPNESGASHHSRFLFQGKELKCRDDCDAGLFDALERLSPSSAAACR
jgi:hypothetical protein